MRVSTSMNASMLTCGSCSPRTRITSTQAGSTVPRHPTSPEEPPESKMSVFQQTVSSWRLDKGEALGVRQDSLFELMDAVLTSPERRTLVRLSLCPCFRRRWSSTCDALADGSLDVHAMRALFQAYAPQP